MAQVFKRPLSPEQLKARQDKINAEIEKQRVIEQKLIVAHLLEKISKLESDKHD